MRLLAMSIACVAAAAVTYIVLRAEFGDRPAHINVRWAPSVTADVQSQLERNIPPDFAAAHRGAHLQL